MPSREKVLNKEQLEAIQHGDGPLLIIAGAGTGKTTVVTERVKWLVSSGKAKPSEILALTFTEKAAREMEERVDIAMPMGYTQMWISTFHSFGDRILRQEALNIGLDPHFNLLSEAETHLLLKKQLYEFELDYFRPHGNPTKFISGMLQHFSRLKDEDIAPQKYLDWAKSRQPSTDKEEVKKNLELARAYQEYESLKVKNSLMDFSDLIANTLKLFRTRPAILKRYQGQFKYVLVDEFQDTNIAQNELVVLLVGKRANLTVVADDDQCLPPGTLVSISNGTRKIEKIKIGDRVVTAVGKGYTSLAKVARVFKREKKARFLTFRTKSGEKITVTDNHKMFCFVPPKVMGKKSFYYVYLMHRLNLGWRLGVTNDLAQRLRLERSADRIIGIKACRSDQEARYYETLFSVKYALPTTCFKPREEVAISGPWIKKLYRKINTESNVQKLAHYLGVNLENHHFCLGGVYRGNQRGVKVNLRMCQRRYRTTCARGRYLSNPKINHELNLETSDPQTIKALKRAGYKLRRAKKGFQLRMTRVSLGELGAEAEKLTRITNGILDIKFDVGKRNGIARPAYVMPASNILPGHYLPLLKKYKVIYDQVVAIKQEVKTETVYDLEVEKSHNFVANGVVIHNSIYKWRGASVSNVLQFKKQFPQTTIVVLAKNYRSTQTILDQAYKLIQNNNPDRLEVKEKIDKKLTAVKNPKVYKTCFFHSDRVENEAEIVAKEIKKLTLDQKKYDFRNIAILVRANAHAEPFTRALYRFGIPYQFLGPGRLLKQPEIKELIAYLKILSDLGDDVACYSILTMDHFQISPRSLATIVSFAKRYNLSLFEGAEATIKGGGENSRAQIRIPEKDLIKLKEIVSMVDRHLKLIPKETAGQILYYFLEDAGLLKKLTEYQTAAEEKKALNIGKFFDRLKTYEMEHEDASLYAVCDWLDLSLEMGESPLAAETDWTENNAVNLLTVHSSKGLEFPVVFLVNLVPQRFPTRERREQISIPDDLIKEILPEGDSHLQEERRLFYVGITRAQDRLYFTAAKYYGEGKLKREVSPFVFEALGNKAEAEIQEEGEQLGLLEWSRQPVEETEDQILPRQIGYLSYSQLETYDRCPRQYKYRYLLRIPVPPSAAASFGTSVHAALTDFYRQIPEKKPPTENDLLAFLKTNWRPEGYLSQAHEKKTFKEAEKMLADFYQTAYSPDQRPLALEEIFTLRIDPTLKIGGRIDRVDQLDNGKIEVIDYKTGKPATQKQVDQDLQMTVYAMAAASPGIYQKDPTGVILSFYFLKSQEKISTQRRQPQLENAKKEILEKAKEIKTSQLEPQPGPHCEFCDYRLLCEAWR